MKWMLAKEMLNWEKSTLLVQVVINRRYVSIIHMIVELIFLLSVNMPFHDGIIPLLSYLNIVIPGRYK